MRLGELGLDVGVLDARDHLAGPYPIPFDEPEVHEPARALGGNGGFPLGHHVAAGHEHGAGARRRHHGGGGEAHRERGAEGAPAGQQYDDQDDDDCGGHADRKPPPGAAVRHRAGGLGGSVDPQSGEVRVLCFHGPNPNTSGHRAGEGAPGRGGVDMPSVSGLGRARTYAPAGSGGGLPSTGPRVAAGLSRAAPSGDGAAGGVDVGATGGNGFPATTRSTSSRSSVSRSSRDAASRSSWSRCLVRMSRACSYASPSRRFSSVSTSSAVRSETSRGCTTARPRKISASRSPTAIGPTTSLMPNCLTIRRAIFVACWMSEYAPVVTLSGPNTSSSATRPPYDIASWPSSHCFVRLRRSFSGSKNVAPSARPRGTMVTLWMGSMPGTLSPTRACPAS